MFSFEKPAGRGKDSKGFSLLELLVAILLLAWMLFFVVGMIPFGNVSVKRDAHILIANDLAQEMMEAIAANFYEDGKVDAGIPTGSSGSEWDGSQAIIGSTPRVSFDGGATWQTPGVFCLSSPSLGKCPSTGAQLDAAYQSTRRPAYSFFPPYPYTNCASCGSLSDYGHTLISTTSAGLPDGRQYYFYIRVRPVTAQGQLIPEQVSGPAESRLRFVQVVVFWQEQFMKGMSAGTNAWEVPGYKNVIFSSLLSEKTGP